MTGASVSISLMFFSAIQSNQIKLHKLYEKRKYSRKFTDFIIKCVLLCHKCMVAVTNCIFYQFLLDKVIFVYATMAYKKRHNIVVYACTAHWKAGT